LSLNEKLDGIYLKRHFTVTFPPHLKRRMFNLKNPNAVSVTGSLGPRRALFNCSQAELKCFDHGAEKKPHCHIETDCLLNPYHILGISTGLIFYAKLVLVIPVAKR